MNYYDSDGDLMMIDNFSVYEYKIKHKMYEYYNMTKQTLISGMSYIPCFMGTYLMDKNKKELIYMILVSEYPPYERYMFELINCSFY